MSRSTRPPLFVLVDCNNFFVSCERLFNPGLEGKPVIVLSSGDGCAVSRSNEAKALGIPMGAPAFKYRDLITKHQVIKFSANFELYGNISRRITALLTSITPRTEIYSVDESFLDISSLKVNDYEEWAREVRQYILDWVGIPVSIGIAPSKTLAKLANLAAKKHPNLGGVLSFVDKTPEGPQHNQQRIDHYTKQTAIGDVWGIGWRLAPKMRGIGVGTAYDMARLRPQQAQQLMGIQGRQLIAELQGTCCHRLTLEHTLPQSIAATRTFGEDTNDTYVLEAAFATFVANASFKLRRSNQLTHRISIFATTNRHKPGYQSWQQTVHLKQPTNDTSTLITAARQAFHGFYMAGVQYHRAGITLHDFSPETLLQTDLLGTIDIARHDSAAKRMRAVDTINNKYGKHTMRIAAELTGNTWVPKHQLRSPGYVSNWSELPLIRK